MTDEPYTDRVYKLCPFLYGVFYGIQYHMPNYFTETPLWLLVHVAPIKSNNDVTVLILLLFKDITLLKQLIPELNGKSMTACRPTLLLSIFTIYVRQKTCKVKQLLVFSVLKAWAYFLVLLYTSINTTHRLGPGKLDTVLTCKANFFSSTKSLFVLKIPPFCEFCGFYMLPLTLCINCGSFPRVSI